MTDSVTTPKTVADVFGSDLAKAWPTKDAGPRPTKVAIATAVEAALAARKRPVGGNVEFMAWVLYARKDGATREHVQVACNSGPAFNKVRAAHKARKLVFTQTKSGPGEATVYRLTTVAVKPAPKPAAVKPAATA